MNFLRSMLDFTLPVLSLASYPEHPEEEVHRQTDTPADQRKKNHKNVGTTARLMMINRMLTSTYTAAWM